MAIYNRDRAMATPPYLLTAYGIAQRHGYSGTEEEWLASLVGAPGEAVDLRFDDETKYIQYKHQSDAEWINLVPMGDLMTEDEAAVLAAMEEIKAAVETAVETAGGHSEDAEAWAVGKRGGVDVEETDETYHNNAKYYAGGAAGSATEAERQKGLAVTAAGEAGTSASNAAVSETNANRSAMSAASGASAAAGSALSAQNSATAAAESAVSAGESASSAAAALSDAESIMTMAQTAANSAFSDAERAHNWEQEAERQAALAAGAAQGAASEVSQELQQYADRAEAASGTAAAAAQTATNQAGAASDSATAAAASAASVSGVVTDVTAAKTEALAAIEAKGAETLDSIPDDYTELSGDVADLKSAVNDTTPIYYTEADSIGANNIYTGVLEVNNAVARKIKNLTVDLSAVQSGSGDPSPDNVRPFTGNTGTTICVGRGNLYDLTQRQTGKIIKANGEIANDNTNQITGMMPIHGANNLRYVFYNPAAAYRSCKAAFYRADGSHILNIAGPNTASKTYRVVNVDDIPSDAEYVIVDSPQTTDEIVVIADYVTKRYTYDSPVYGGSLDVIEGTLTVTHGYIDSYNGEELPGKWLSSMDVYAEGTTPTTGAQVVYELAAPTVSSVETMPVTLAKGKNVIMAYDMLPRQNAVHLLYPVGADTALDTAGVPADSETLGDAVFTNEIPLYACYFASKQFVSIRGSITNYNGGIRSVTFDLNAPVRIVSDDPNISVCVYTNGYRSPITTEYMVDRLVSAKIMALKNDGTIFSATDLSHVHAYSTYGGAQEFAGRYTIKVTETRVFGAADADNKIGNDRLIDDVSNPAYGMHTANGAYRSTYVPYYSDNDMDIWITRNGTITADIFIGGECHTISSGQKYHIPAGTQFTVSFVTSPSDMSGNYQSAVLMIVDGTDPTRFVNVAYQLPQTPAIQSAARVGDKVITIGSGSTYSVYLVDNGSVSTLTSNADLGHDTGHANQANYSNGKMYVSNWTDYATINVFDYDDESNTLTFDRDIVMPLDDTFGSTGYHVFDDANQIYFYGWTAGRNTTQYGLFIKSGETYQLAWKKYAPAPDVINGFTVQGHYIYAPNNVYISGDAWRYDNLYRIDMITGEKQYNDYAPTGSILKHESEAIEPIGEGVFLMHSHIGYTFVQTFKARARA